MGEQIYSYAYQAEIGLLRIKLSILIYFGYIFLRLTYIVPLHKERDTNICINEMLFPSLLYFIKELKII